MWEINYPEISDSSNEGAKTINKYGYYKSQESNCCLVFFVVKYL